MKPVTAARMRRADRAATRRLKIPVLLLMDNAGRSVAEAARAFLKNGRGKKIMVLCGGGNNGGDGLAAARYLQGWGGRVSVFWLHNPAHWTGDLARHYEIAKRCGVAFSPWAKIPPARRVGVLRRADLLIDALLGTGARGHLRIPMFDAIVAMNASRRPVLAVDIPSGLDPDTGAVREHAVRARLTVTLAAPKKGLVARGAKPYVGKLIVADIGLPASLLN